MHSFNFFIKEQVEGSSIDAAGKLFELHTMHQLQGGQHATHYRSSQLGSPEHAAKTLRDRVPTDTHEKILSSSRAAAAEIQNHITNNHPDFQIHKVTWTSNPNDISKYHEEHKTGNKQSADDNADYVVSLRHPKTGEVRHLGISSKYTDKPTTRSPGFDSLAAMAKVSTESVSKIIKHHNNNIDAAMSFPANTSTAQKKERFRSIDSNSATSEKESKATALKIARTRGENLASHLHQGFSNITENRDHHIRKSIGTLLGVGNRSIDTITVKTDKRKKPVISNDNETTSNVLNKLNNFRTEARNNLLHFYGTHPQTGKEYHLASVEFRSKSTRSSPHIPYQGAKPGKDLDKLRKTL